MANQSTEPMQRPDAAVVNEQLASFRREVEKRKQALLANRTQQLDAASGPSAVPASQPPAILDAQARIAQLRANISKQIANTNLASTIPSAFSVENAAGFARPAGPQPNIVMDAEGQMVDASTGQVVQMQHRKPPSSVKANQRATTSSSATKPRREDSGSKVSIKPADNFALSELDADKQLKQSAVYDDSLVMRPAARAKRQFRFYDKGTFEKQGEHMRKQVQVQRLNAEIAERAEKAGILSAAALSRLSSSSVGFNDSLSGDTTAIPDAEWWDGELWECYVKADLPTSENNEVAANDSLRAKVNPEIYGDFISADIEHPVQAAPPTSIDKDINLPIMLTSKERKKLRRQTRRERLKEKQDRIRLGLDPPTEPKVKLSNFMRVLGNDAIRDPTKAEVYVKKQMAERKRKHDSANENRKLKPEERRAEQRRKLEEDTSEEVHVTVYAVRDLSSRQRQWKVQKNINDLLMSGVVMFHKQLSVVVAEGGPKQQKKLRRLMLHRIKWIDDNFDQNSDANGMDIGADADDDAADSANGGRAAIEIEHAAGCHLVWSGIVTKRQFPRPLRNVKPFDTEDKVREFFKQHKCEHYWDAASGSKFMLEQEVRKLRS